MALPPPSCWKLSSDPFVKAEKQEGFPMQHTNHVDVGRAWKLGTHSFSSWKPGHWERAWWQTQRSTSPSLLFEGNLETQVIS